VAGLAVDIDHFARGVNVFGDAEFLVELIAVLVKVGDFQLGADSDTALAGLEFLEEEVEQRGFTGAIQTKETIDFAGLQFK
jgi:hypothetical protein